MRDVRICGAMLVAFAAATANAQTSQFVQGQQLFGTGASTMIGINAPQQGYSVGLSADGSTAIVGAPFDSEGIGATWVWVLGSDGTWTQQGSKMVASDAVSGSEEGYSVALSADGNTAIVGGASAAWIWTRANNVWTQQGSTLAAGAAVAISADGNTAIATGEPGVNNAGATITLWTRSNDVWTQGSSLAGSLPASPTEAVTSIAISGDGQTIVFGAASDNSLGAVWVFTFDAGNWTQQGLKIVPNVTASSFVINFGQSVSLSADGNTMLVGDPGDGDTPGADGQAWIYERTAGVWSETAELNGSGSASIGAAGQGTSVALSGDGNTAIIGGPEDASSGALWVFKQSNGSWTQLGSKLVPSNDEGAWFGWSLGISADGKTVISGGRFNNDYAGAAWLYYASAFGVVPGQLTQMSVAADGTIVGLNSAGGIFTYNAQQQAFAQLPGRLQQIAAGSATAIWGINAQQQIFEWNASAQSWTLIPGALAQIAVGADGDVWGLNYHQHVYQCLEQSRSWQTRGGALKLIGVGVDGAGGSDYSCNRVERGGRAAGRVEV